MQQQHSQRFFVFTKKEKRGTIAVLIIILFIFTIAEFIYPLMNKDKDLPAAEMDSAVALLKRMPADSNIGYRKNESSNHHYPAGKTYEPHQPFTGTMLYFDPNTIDEAGWEKLGVRQRTAQGILKYISKGGKFRRPDDLNKIWGLNEEEKKRLIPYARIAEKQNTYAPGENYPRYEKKTYEKKTIAAVDVNSADTTAFIALPGIGPGFSRRIVNFRNRLGGFYKPEQVAETFGLPDSVYRKIKPYLKISGEVKKININTATAEELKAHPYIRWQLANIITEYRKQHGNFKNADDLRKIMAIDGETMSKILPYIEF